MAQKPVMANKAEPANTDHTELKDGPLYPGGADNPAYRFAFNSFAVLFLLLVCVGLLNYLGWYVKARAG